MKSPKLHKGLRLDSELVEKVNRQAAKERRTFSQMVHVILDKFFDKPKKENN